MVMFHTGAEPPPLPRAQNAPVGVALDQRVAEANRWRDGFNPLRGLTVTTAVSLLEQYERGDYGRVLYTIRFVEKTDPDLMALMSRWTAAIKKLTWNVKTVDVKKGRERTIDATLAEEQATYLRQAYERIDNLKEAIEHLVLANFRGFSHVQPQIYGDGKRPVGSLFYADHMECLEQWNILRDGSHGEWFWNPTGQHSTTSGLDQLDPTQFLIRTIDRPIGRIALLKFIRSNLSEKDWDAFVEIYGIPACIIIGPPTIPAGKEKDFETAADRVSGGGSGSLPNGSTVDRAESVRGTSPYKARLDHLTEKLILAGTGGKLSMLAAPTGIGSGASESHDKVFDDIAQAEALAISEVFQQQYDKRLLAGAFPGRPVLAYFEIAANEETDIGEILKHDSLLAASGRMIETESLAGLTGYTIVPATPRPVSAPGNGFPLMNRAAPASNRRGPDDPVMGRLLAASRDQLGTALAADLKPIRDRIEKALNLEDPGQQREMLRTLQSELPELLKQVNAQPAAARVLEGALAAALVNGLAEQPGQNASGPAAEPKEGGKS